MRASTIATLAVVSLAASSSAWADAKSKARAKELYEEGLRHYNVAEYAEAIRVWKEAYLISKRPLLLFNLGQAYRLSGDCKQAMDFYDSYRREGATADNLKDLEEAEGVCKAKLAEKPAEPDTTPTVPAAPTTAVPPPERHATGMRKAGIAVGIAGVVSGGVAIYFARDSASIHDEINLYRGEWDAAHAELNADGKRSENLAWAFGLGGVAAIGAGVALYVIGGTRAESSGVSLAPTRGGAQVAWSFVF
jgi:tetratricopeptide (TPR) repeat protein